MTVSFFHYLIGVDQDSGLKSAVESALNGHSQELANNTTYTQPTVLLAHRSKRNDDAPSKHIPKAALVILLVQGHPGCEIDSEARYEVPAWKCGTELIRDWFPLLKAYVETHASNLGNIDPAGWLPRLDRLTAWAILCQGYLAAHGGDGLAGFDGVSEATKRRLQDMGSKTRTREWWLGPILAGTGLDPNKVRWDQVEELFKKELGEMKWDWSKAKALFNDFKTAGLKAFVSDFASQYGKQFPPGFADADRACKSPGSDSAVG